MRAVFFVTLFSLTTKSPPPFTYIYIHTQKKLKKERRHVKLMLKQLKAGGQKV